MKIANMLRAVVRSIYRRLLPQGARNNLRAWMILDAPDRPPEFVESFDEARVLVLAPHMDDEVVGCGGALRRHALAGASITVVFLTDGRAGDRHITAENRQSEAEIRAAEDVLCERRKKESAAAAQILGYESLVFLDRPDGSLTIDDALIREVAALIEQYDPKLIYYPCMLELHPDHWQASRLLAKLVDAGSPPALAGVRCRGYEAWTPLMPNCLIDITDVFDAKLAALRVFTSQLRNVDYARTTTGLNAYRSVTRDGKGYCEAFYESSAAQHAELVRQLDIDR